MFRIRGLLPSRQMASRVRAIVQTYARQVVIVIDVARRAGRLRMQPLQWKTSRGMVELSPEPVVHCVAILTILRRKLGTGCEVVWYARAKGLGTLIIFRMA